MDLPEFNLDQMVRLLGDKDITIARLQILVERQAAELATLLKQNPPGDQP